MQSKRAVQPETNHSFRRNMNFTALRNDLRSGSCTRACGRANRRAFSATCDCSDDCAEYGSATDKLSGAFIRSHTVAVVLQFLIFGAHTIASTLHRDGLNVKSDVAIPFQPPGNKPCLGPTGDCD